MKLLFQFLGTEGVFHTLVTTKQSLMMPKTKSLGTPISLSWGIATPKDVWMDHIYSRVLRVTRNKVFAVWIGGNTTEFVNLWKLDEKSRLNRRAWRLKVPRVVEESRLKRSRLNLLMPEFFLFFVSFRYIAWERLLSSTDS